MQDLTYLDRKKLLPIAIGVARRQDAHVHRALLPPLPACPTCSEVPKELVQVPPTPSGRPMVLHFRPCGHTFTASEDDIGEAVQTAYALVEQQKNRPAGERAEVPCRKWSLEEAHDAHDWIAPVDGPARCPGHGGPVVGHVSIGLDYVREHYGEGATPQTHRAYLDGGHAEPAPPQTDTEKIRDLERVIERVREAVGTDTVLVGCEKHEPRITALEDVLREVLAQFVHPTHPGEPCKQTGHVAVRAIDRWHAVLGGEAP